MAADLAIMDPDALDLDPAAAAVRQAKMTVVGGAIVWQRSE
jgi:predicted amidohydrolase YtcJ